MENAWRNTFDGKHLTEKPWRKTLDGKMLDDKHLTENTCMCTVSWDGWAAGAAGHHWPSSPIGTVSCTGCVLCHRTGGPQEPQDISWPSSLIRVEYARARAKKAAEVEAERRRRRRRKWENHTTSTVTVGNNTKKQQKQQTQKIIKIKEQVIRIMKTWRSTVNKNVIIWEANGNLIEAYFNNEADHIDRWFKHVNHSWTYGRRPETNQTLTRKKPSAACAHTENTQSSYVWFDT